VDPARGTCAGSRVVQSWYATHGDTAQRIGAGLEAMGYRPRVYGASVVEGWPWLCTTLIPCDMVTLRMQTQHY
jgi:hypothetical protein